MNGDLFFLMLLDTHKKTLKRYKPLKSDFK